MRHAIFIAPFGPLSDPHRLTTVAEAAEAHGWDGVFLWDHMLRPRAETLDIADTWVSLAAMAVATDRIALGPMVTPITRRRPQKLAREAATLDHLSGGRVILGLGLGVDSGRELTAFGEIGDARVRASRLDEGAALLSALWTGEEVVHRGEHFTADGVILRPRPVQQPRIPLWFAARGDALAPVRRAARYDGLFPIDVGADQYARMIDVVRAERGTLDGFDVAVRVEPGDPTPGWALETATWTLHGFGPVEPADRVLAVITAGPPT